MSPPLAGRRLGQRPAALAQHGSRRRRERHALAPCVASACKAARDPGEMPRKKRAWQQHANSSQIDMSCTMCVTLQQLECVELTQAGHPGTWAWGLPSAMKGGTIHQLERRTTSWVYVKTLLRRATSIWLGPGKSLAHCCCTSRHHPQPEGTTPHTHLEELLVSPPC
jgi:hypothetical protein